MMKCILYCLAAEIFTLITASNAATSTKTSELMVRMNIVAGCGIIITEGVNFNVRNYIADSVKAAGKVIIICTPGLRYNVALDGG